MHAPVHCILAVWGKTYTDIFLRCSLPSQLAEGNIPALRDNPHARYRIFTTEADMTAMRQNAAFRRLESLIRVDFVPLSTLAATGDARDKLDRLAECHNAAIRQADREDASLIFLSPDFVFSTGCLAYGLRRWERGDNVVYTLTPRLVRESVLAELEARELAGGSEGADGAKSSAGSGGIAPADLGEIALRHLHPIEKGYFRGASLVSFPIHVYWPAGDEGFVAHCAYLHPLFVRPLRRGERPAITIDADYVDRCCPDQSRIHWWTTRQRCSVWNCPPRICRISIHAKGGTAFRPRRAVLRAGLWRTPTRFVIRSSTTGFCSTPSASAAAASASRSGARRNRMPAASCAPCGLPSWRAGTACGAAGASRPSGARHARRTCRRPPCFAPSARWKNGCMCPPFRFWGVSATRANAIKK